MCSFFEQKFRARILLGRMVKPLPRRRAEASESEIHPAHAMIVKHRHAVFPCICNLGSNCFLHTNLAQERMRRPSLFLAGSVKQGRIAFRWILFRQSSTIWHGQHMLMVS